MMQRITPRPPALVLLVAVLALMVLIIPIVALALRVPWANLGVILSQPTLAPLITVTLSAAAFSTLITTVLGLGLALWIHSLRRGAQVARLLVLLPLAMPPVVSGLALSAALGNRGLLHPMLDALNWQFAFAFPGVVLSHVFVSLPFVVVTVDSALRQIDQEILDSAAGIGMNPWRVLTRITLPTIAPAIATGAGLACARSLGEFGTTITFAGSMPGLTRTLSLAIYLEREVDRDSAYALAALLIALAILSLLLAFLPGLFQRKHRECALSTDPLDVERLRALTTPSHSAPELSIDGWKIPAHSTTAVIGPNGSGKTTLLKQLSGRVSGRAISISGRPADALPAHRRGIVMLTQRPGLPRFCSVHRALTMATQDPHRTTTLLEAAGLSVLSSTPVAALSGGQAAQVALLRALAVRPRVLILDESLAAVDVDSAARWREVLHATAATRTTIMVTHDPVDVAGLASSVIAMDSGEIVAAGLSTDVLAAPPTAFVARLAGLNRFEGVISQVGPGDITMKCQGLKIHGIFADGVPADHYRVGDMAIATIPPEATSLRVPGGPQSSARNVWPATVLTVTATSSISVDVTLRFGQKERISVPITRASALMLDLRPGRTIECITKALSVVVHPTAR